MEDDHVEQSLRAYRPAAPSLELRERVLLEVPQVLGVLQVRNVLGLRVQLAVAAALLLAALLLHSATERIDRRIAVAPVSVRDADQQALDELTHELGGDANARLMAPVILMRDEQEARIAPDPEVPQ